jgi:hypothetical protein
LHRSLVAAGVDSHFLTLESRDFHPREGENVIKRGPLKKFLSKLTALLSNKLFQSTYFTLFSSSVITSSKLSRLGFHKDVVLHLHNSFNFVSTRQLSRLLENGYRMIVTLHDQRFFTGGCHYSLKCDGFTMECKKCPLLPNVSFNFLVRKNHKSMADLIARYNSQILFLAPSKWIFMEAKRSSILKYSRIQFQPNLHTEFELEFNQVSKSLGKLSRERGDFIVGVASMDSSSPLKGSDLVLQVMDTLGTDRRHFQIKQLSQCPQTREGRIGFWREIDCLLVLSRGDNSPNVIHEAKIAGVPVIGTDVGGIPELLNQNFDFVFNHDSNLIENVSHAIAQISQKSTAIPQKINLRYKSPDSRGSIEGFLKIYTDSH